MWTHLSLSLETHAHGGLPSWSTPVRWDVDNRIASGHSGRPLVALGHWSPNTTGPGNIALCVRSNSPRF